MRPPLLHNNRKIGAEDKRIFVTKGKNIIKSERKKNSLNNLPKPSFINVVKIFKKKERKKH